MDSGRQREVSSYTDHCRMRMAQRNVSADDVQYIVARGAMEYRTGVQCYTLPRRCIPAEERSDRASLETLVVLVCDGCVITVYRNRHPLRHIRRKAKYHDPNLKRRGSLAQAGVYRA